MGYESTKTLLGRLFRLSDPQVFIVALVALIVEAGLRFGTVPRLARTLGIQMNQDQDFELRPNAAKPDDLPTLWMIRKRHLAVTRVFRHWPFGDTCLRRALVLGQRLRHLDPVLMIGVKHNDSGSLQAHAWIAVAGIALDPLAAQYEAFRDFHRE